MGQDKDEQPTEKTTVETPSQKTTVETPVDQDKDEKKPAE